MPISDLPPSRHQQEQIVCSITAARKYNIPANILLAIAEKESGLPGLWVKNSNGTYDVGTMQFNTAYIKTLEQFGITPNDLAAPGCYAYELAAWRVHGHITKDHGDIWTRAANYHSKTPYYNQIYRADLKAKANRWAKWLDKFKMSHIMTLHEYSVQFEAKPATSVTHIVSQLNKTAYVARRIISRQ
jgi:Transglycosylase SLT domain